MILLGRPDSAQALLRALQGLLLDCEAATLTVWVNGERKGVMARPGMTSAASRWVGWRGRCAGRST